MPIINYVLAFMVTTAAGMINALAGGGTLLTFPFLLAIGLPPVTANVTNTLGLFPGSLAGTLAQANDLKGQRNRLWIVIPTAFLGGLTGGILLLKTNEALFSNLVPFLILLAACLLAIQAPLHNWLAHRQVSGTSKVIPETWLLLPVFMGAVYGGYFGAGLGIILLAVFGLLLKNSLAELNVLKQLIAFTTNFTASVLFIFSGKAVWSIAAVMMAGALLGGTLGGRLASKVKPAALRWIMVTIGFIVGMIYLVRTYFIT
jgi:uncharacterized protein